MFVYKNQKSYCFKVNDINWIHAEVLSLDGFFPQDTQAIALNLF